MSKRIAAALALDKGKVSSEPVGRAWPISPANEQEAPRKIDANIPGGVHRDSISNPMVPFLGQNQLPTGQVINVSMNAPSPHLSFKEWMARGVVGGIGGALTWPFRFVGNVIEEIAKAIVGVLKWAIIVILLPALAIVGFKLAGKLTSSATIEDGAASLVYDGRHAVNGIAKGATTDLPPEKRSDNPKKD